MKVLVTGGAGYIGSTTATALEAAGHTPVILDSLLTGAEEFVNGRNFYRGDISDRDIVRRVVTEHPDIDVTIHMASRVIVPESVANPSTYYRDNVAKTLDFLEELCSLGRPRVVFSSSASVYSDSPTFEVREGDAVAPKSPYARTKLMIEQILEDLSHAETHSAISLRYFNPIGSDPDLRSGVHLREPSHVLGQLVLVSQGRYPAFSLTGDQYPTRDGTGLRDYVHVWDLAQAHVRAVEAFDEVLTAEGRPSTVINIGTGCGVTVRELIAAFESVSGSSIPVAITDPRPGDSIGAFANVDKAAQLLAWRSSLSIEEGITSALAWAEKRKSVLGY